MPWVSGNMHSTVSYRVQLDSLLVLSPLILLIASLLGCCSCLRPHSFILIIAQLSLASIMRILHR